MALHSLRVSYRNFQQLALVQNCKRFLSKRLLLVNTGTCCMLYTVGDVIQQHIEGRDRLDWARIGRMATLGFCMGPINHYWYLHLDRFLPGATGKVVLKKVLADQIVMAPVCCSVFYIGMCSLEGRGWQQTQSELRVKFWPTYKTDWQIWPAAQIFNFYVVPPALRVTYVNIVTLVWTVYLSYMKHKQQPKTIPATTNNQVP